MYRLLLGIVLAFTQAENLPPAYPRPGTVNMIDNDRVLVWNIAWLKQTYPLHRHRYDLVGVYYTSGDRAIVSTNGNRRPVSTKPWEIAFQAKGVTHIEEGASDEPLKAVFVELKQDAPRGDANPEDPFLQRSGRQVLDNARATVWEFIGGIAAAPHQHGRDAVVISFKNGTPTARFVAHGTSHDNEGDAAADRQYVIELK